MELAEFPSFFPDATRHFPVLKSQVLPFVHRLKKHLHTSVFTSPATQTSLTSNFASPLHISPLFTRTLSAPQSQSWAATLLSTHFGRVQVFPLHVLPSVHGSVPHVHFATSIALPSWQTSWVKGLQVPFLQIFPGSQFVLHMQAVL